MGDSKEGPSEGSPDRPKEYPMVGTLGFHYTVDNALPGILQHGLLSRVEEEKRGLQLRGKRTRQAQPDQVYFTSRINDLYFLYSPLENPDQTVNEALQDVVGIAIDRPESRERNFIIENVVEPEKFRALVFVDTEVSFTDQRKIDAYGKYEFGNPLPEETVRARVESLRKICQQTGVDLLIYGVSGDMYYPERKTRDEIREEALGHS